MKFKMQTAFWLACLLTAFSAAQSKGALQLRITPERDEYFVDETALVKAELTNVSSKTLCFPKPNQECFDGSIGSLLTGGLPENIKDGVVFFCHVDAPGKWGSELEQSVKSEWIRLEPGKSYVTKYAKVQAKLDVTGQWNLLATYTPPEGAFSRDYRKHLQAAAQKAGCTMPEDPVAANATVTIK
jgi:hypothetical protein